MDATVDIYGGRDPLNIPMYSYADASRYLNLPTSTVRYWVKGGVITRGEDREFYKPVLTQTADSGLTFLDLVELHVLKALRKVHGVKLDNVRRAVLYAERELQITRLLLHEELSTYGREVFIRHLDKLINLSQGGQLTLEHMLDRYLKRVERDDSLTPVKFYPTFDEGADEGCPVVIDPRVSFGRPTVRGTGINTHVIAQRIDAGETVAEVAEDYRIEPYLVVSAVQYENVA